MSLTHRDDRRGAHIRATPKSNGKDYRREHIRSSMTAENPSAGLQRWMINATKPRMRRRESLKGGAVHTGTVGWFDPEIGYGFITSADGDKNIFVHINEVKKSGRSTLLPHEEVRYVVKTDSRRRRFAVLLKPSLSF